MRTRILSIPFAVLVTLCGQNAFSMNNLNSLTNMYGKRPFKVIEDINTTVLPASKRRRVEEGSRVMTLCGQNAFSMNNLNSLTNIYGKRPFEVIEDINTTVLPASKRRRVEESSSFDKYEYDLFGEGSSSDNDEYNKPVRDSLSLDDDYILSDSFINKVLSDLDHSNLKLYRFKNIEIFGNIDVLQSKILKIYTCRTVNWHWNANIIGEDNRGLFLRGKSENIPYPAYALIGPINALRLISDTNKEIHMFTNQDYVLDGITDWINKWKTKNWIKSDKQPVKYRKLWEELDRQFASHRVRWYRYTSPNENIRPFFVEDVLKSEKSISDYADILIDHLNTKRATFTQEDIEKLIRLYIFDPIISGKVLKETEGQVSLIGIDKFGEPLYTGKKYQKIEESVMKEFQNLSKIPAYTQCSESSVNDVLSQTEYSFLSDEQISAIKNLVRGSNFCVLIGKAGTGKTTAMKAISEIFKANGSRVIGMCLSAIASENLGKEANIKSRSIADWCYKWESCDAALRTFNTLTSPGEKYFFNQTLLGRYRTQNKNLILKKGDVIIVDEASMVSTNDWNAILKFAKKFGAKVIAVGDNHQFAPISAGNMFEQFVQKSDSVNELKEIRRQTQAWQREASIEFSKLNTRAALEMYKDHGKIHEVGRNLEKIVANKYLEHFEKDKSVVVLCSTNKECFEINKEIRELLIKHNKLGANIVQVDEKPFAEGEKIMFLSNDSSFGVKNGQQGIVKSFEIVKYFGNEYRLLVIQTDDDKIRIDVDKYNAIDYAYAITLHKSQGKTYDNTIVIANKKMINARSIYVGMTRHRDDVDLYYKRSIFGSFENLVKCASRYEYKDSLVDYLDIERLNRDRVAEFIKLYEQINDKTNAFQVNQNEYQSKKNRAVVLGEEILGNYDAHKLYLKQMGLTRETVEEIHVRLKQGTLKSLEKSANDKTNLSQLLENEDLGKTDKKIKEKGKWSDLIKEELRSLKNEDSGKTNERVSSQTKEKRVRDLNLLQYLENGESRKTNEKIPNQVKRRQRRMVFDLSQYLEDGESKKTHGAVSGQIQDWKNIYVMKINSFPQDENPKETNKKPSDQIKGIQEWNEWAMEVLRSLKNERPTEINKEMSDQIRMVEE